jgi:hypothetical protein
MDNNQLTERQEFYVGEYQKIYREIESLENQILGMAAKMKDMESRLQELRNQEKTEFNYGKEE